MRQVPSHGWRPLRTTCIVSSPRRRGRRCRRAPDDGVLSGRCGTRAGTPGWGASSYPAGQIVVLSTRRQTLGGPSIRRDPASSAAGVPLGFVGTWFRRWNFPRSYREALLALRIHRVAYGTESGHPVRRSWPLPPPWPTWPTLAGRSICGTIWLGAAHRLTTSRVARTWSRR